MLNAQRRSLQYVIRPVVATDIAHSLVILVQLGWQQ